MAEKLKKGDFVEVEYDGFLKETNIMFDSTDEKKAKENHIYSENAKYGSVTICIGENQLLGKLDDSLIDADVGSEKTVHLAAENAFGKKDAKLLRIVPISVFKKEQIQPMPGLQVSVDGMFGIIKSVSGGRVIVDFNHPLSGKDVYYKIKADRIISDDSEKISSFVSVSLDLPKSIIGIKVEEGTADIKLPFKLPSQIADKLEESVKRLIKIQKITFTEEKQEKEPSSEEKKDTHGRDSNDPHYGHNHE